VTGDGIRLHMLDSQLAHTYSIVARDPETGEMGVAVESHYFAVGSAVTWAEAGVGIVATQALVEPAYGKLGLDLMRAGKSAPDTLTGLVASDAANAVRQVAMLDAEGRAAAHTGASTISEAGHIIGEGFSVQANMMLRPTVWPAMAETYQSAKGELVDRLLAVLDAAEGEGGDIRGRQSAAILVVSVRTRAVHGSTLSTISEWMILLSRWSRCGVSYRSRVHTRTCGSRGAPWREAISTRSILSSMPLRA